MTVDHLRTAQHLKLTMTAKGLLKDMIIATELKGENLVLEWKRINVPADLPNTPQKVEVSFANAASAEYARHLLIYGTSDLGDDVKERKPAVSKHVAGSVREARTFEAC